MPDTTIISHFPIGKPYFVIIASNISYSKFPQDAVLNIFHVSLPWAHLLPPANEVCEGYVLHMSVCPRGGGVPGQVPPGAVHAGRYGQQAGGTHPTGMHSCVKISSYIGTLISGVCNILFCYHTVYLCGKALVSGF